MAAWSVARDGKLPFTIVASPIFVLSSPDDWQTGGTVVFEVFEIDSEKLSSLVGVAQHYALDDQTFSGVIEWLKPYSAPNLNRLTLRGSITALPEGVGQH
jgi:hypothetical protein